MLSLRLEKRKQEKAGETQEEAPATEKVESESETTEPPLQLSDGQDEHSDFNLYRSIESRTISAAGAFATAGSKLSHEEVGARAVHWRLSSRERDSCIQLYTTLKGDKAIAFRVTDRQAK
ncbi:hypothetical protein HW555_000634 [Spodoptera exigua]|uniref:Uncharacterized protein n=1 Tax=Spodoptera exigua TaxID=7107 RepID=A0A835GR06_SPOEX|nr:hypothetical protein HW555_000634 [Spodoptera exigua]